MRDTVDDSGTPMRLPTGKLTRASWAELQRRLADPAWPSNRTTLATLRLLHLHSLGRTVEGKTFAEIALGDGVQEDVHLRWPESDPLDIRKARIRMWELMRGPLPEGCAVLAKCDERRCITPEHLYLP